MRGQIWLPRSLAAQPQTRRCRICRDPLTESEYPGHVALCYRRNEAEVRSQSLRERAPVICGDVGVDLELEHYYRTRGKHAS